MRENVTEKPEVELERGRADAPDAERGGRRKVREGYVVSDKMEGASPDKPDQGTR